MKRVSIFILLFWFLFGKEAYPQNASITLSDVSYCETTIILIPATVVNLLNVGSMSLDIAFDTLCCSFKSLKNINPAFNGLMYNMLYTPQAKLRILYYNIAGTSLSAGKIFDIEFVYKAGQTDLHFLPSCEITTPTFQPILTVYNDGSVKNLVTIIQQPENQTVVQPNTAFFNIIAEGNPSYQWQQSVNNGNTWLNLSNSSTFQGVTTSQLAVNNTNNFLNGRLYRCQVINQGCMGYSNNAKLTVLPLLINHQVNLPSGWSGISSYIDPENKNLPLMFSEISDKLIILITGEQMYYPSQGINTIGLYNAHKGYTIKVSEATDLTITGSVQTNKTIEIPTGWSHLPVLENCEVPIQRLFDSNIEQVHIIKEIAGAKVFWPEMNIITLTNLTPGKAYLIRMHNPAVIHFPGCN